MSWENFLRKKGIKVTIGRVVLLNILQESSKGISAEELHLYCKEQEVNLNLSTIYRSLELFEEQGIIKKIGVGNGPCVYVLKKETHNHVVKCDICNKSVSIPCPMEQLEEIIKSEAGFSLTDHKLELKGICKICKNNN